MRPPEEQLMKKTEYERNDTHSGFMKPAGTSTVSAGFLLVGMLLWFLPAERGGSTAPDP